MLFTKDNAQQLQDLIKDVPLARVSYDALGGASHASLMILICFDPKESWKNGIMENSRYIRLSADSTDSIEQFSGGYGLSKKFRKSRFKSIEDIANKLNKYISEVS